MRRELRRWRGEREGSYKRKRREYREFCEEKKKEENDKWMGKVKEAKRESDVWELINKDRKKRKGRINEEIEMEECKEYFKSLLGGVKERVIGRERKEERIEEEGMSREEIRRAVNRVRVGKATGSDGISGEMWKCGGDRLEEWLWRFCSGVWKWDEWPENWRDGEIVPIIT